MTKELQNDLLGKIEGIMNLKKKYVDQASPFEKSFGREGYRLFACWMALGEVSVSLCSAIVEQHEDRSLNAGEFLSIHRRLVRAHREFGSKMDLGQHYTMCVESEIEVIRERGIEPNLQTWAEVRRRLKI